MIKTTPLFGSDRQLIGEITVARDVTALHRQEEALRAAQVTLQERLAALSDANGSLAREIAAPHPFIEVFIDTPLDECIRRNPKGLYAKAKSGGIPNFTGLDSPYEAPEKPELRLSTVGQSPDALADDLLETLRSRGVVG